MGNNATPKKAPIILTIALTGAEVKRLRAALQTERRTLVEDAKVYYIGGPELDRSLVEIEALLAKIPASREE